jgi:hypothetical protein
LQGGDILSFDGLVRDNIGFSVSCVFYVSCNGDKLVLLQQSKFMLWLAASYRQRFIVKANGLAGDTKRISETTRESIETYERRMRIFNLAIVVAALMVLPILIIRLSDAWFAFEKSLGLRF